jgi:SAM-dependent methyltransferase
VLDFGGGFGTLARCIAKRSPGVRVDIHEPFPPRHGIESCRPYQNISFVSNLPANSYDALVCTDVLEHVHDPLALLATMIGAVRINGILVIANCFYPVIACHLPCTFHFRHSFDRFCEALGLEQEGASPGGHGVIYTRKKDVEPNWPKLRRMEKRSQRAFPLREWSNRHLHPWGRRFNLAITQPGYYGRKISSLMKRTH